nr:potassium/proton antiporter [Elioraea tepidiphila]
MDWIFTTIFIGAALIVLSVFTSLIAFRFGTPLLLFFLGIGLLVGEDGLGLQFDDAASAYFVGSLALAVILFDSGFSTRWRTFRQAAGPAVVLATLGVLLTTALLGACIHYIFSAPWPESLLISAIVSSTDAAAVFFLLRTGGITIKESVRATLEVESGSNDPMAVFLTVLLVELVAAGGGVERLTTDLLVGFVTQMGLGLAFGVAGGLLIVQLVNRVELENALYPIVVLAAALVLFSLTGALGGSGFLAAYVAGLVAGNRRMRALQSLRRFQEGMTWLAQIAMFLILGLLATPSEFPAAALSRPRDRRVHAGPARRVGRDGRSRAVRGRRAGGARGRCPGAHHRGRAHARRGGPGLAVAAVPERARDARARAPAARAPHAAVTRAGSAGCTPRPRMRFTASSAASAKGESTASAPIPFRRAASTG